MQDFLRTGFLFAWSRAGGPVRIFMAPLDHFRPYGGDTYNLEGLPPTQGQAVLLITGLELDPAQEGQAWWCSVGCRYLTSNSFLL